MKYNGFARKEPIADWEECYSTIQKVIEEKGVVKSRDMNRQIVLISYFFERAVEAGLIGKMGINIYKRITHVCLKD